MQIRHVDSVARPPADSFHEAVSVQKFNCTYVGDHDKYVQAATLVHVENPVFCHEFQNVDKEPFRDFCPITRGRKSNALVEMARSH
jgi:hypothetical protein